MIRPLMAVHKARTELVMNLFGLLAKGKFEFCKDDRASTLSNLRFLLLN